MRVNYHEFYLISINREIYVRILMSRKIYFSKRKETKNKPKYQRSSITTFRPFAVKMMK